MSYAIYTKRGIDNSTYTYTTCTQGDLWHAKALAGDYARHGWTVKVLDKEKLAEVYAINPCKDPEPDPKLLRLYRNIIDLRDMRDHAYSFADMGKQIDAVIAAYEELQGR